MKKSTTYTVLFFIMMIWGFNVTALKLLVAEFSPVTITSFRILTASIIVMAVLFSLKKVRWLTKKETGHVLAGSLLNVVAHHYFLSVGMKFTSVSNGGLILGLGPILTSIMAIIFLKNRISLIKGLGIISGFSGVFFIIAEGSGVTSVSFGDVYVFLSISSQALSFILIKKAAKTLDPRLMTGYMLLFGSVILFFISLVTEPDGLTTLSKGSWLGWLVFLGSAIFATAIGHMAYNSALGKIGAPEAAIFLNLNPFFALIGAVLFVGEKILLTQIIGFAFILAGVFLGSGAFEEKYKLSKHKRTASGVKSGQ